MKTLSALSLVLLVACGGGSSSHNDLSASKPADLSATPYDFSTTQHDLAPANNDAGGPIAAACLNICKCFMSTSEQTKCTALCESQDSRFDTWAGSGSFSSSAPGMYSGSLSGMFAGQSSLSSGIPVVPTTACLNCLAHASCTDLEQDNACTTECPY